MRLPAVVAYSVALALSIYACSDDPASSPSGTGGSAGEAGEKATGGESSSAGTSTGGKGNSAGTSAGGKSGLVAGAGVGGDDAGGNSASQGGTGEGGTGEGGSSQGGMGGTGEGGAGGEAIHAKAKITLVASTGTSSTVAGTVCFEQVGDTVTMHMAVEASAFGDYPMHLHANAVCGVDGADAGAHWGGTGGPGEGGSIPLAAISCKNGPPYNCVYDYTPADGTWTIGGAEATNILNHVMVVHADGASDRISCGLPVEIDADADCP